MNERGALAIRSRDLTMSLTHFLRLIRGIMLRDASLRELWPDMLALIGFTLAMMGLVVSRFRKRLD